MKSMTGYGVGRRAKKDLVIEVSLRAVNGRFFDCKIHFPSEYQSIEKDIRERLAKKILRGSLSVVIVRKRTGGTSPRQVLFDQDLARQWVDGFRKLGKSLKLKDEPSLAALTGFSDIVSVRERAEVQKGEHQVVLACVDEALKTLELERIREGKKLHKDVEGRIASLGALCGEISKLRTEANTALRKRLEKRIDELKLKNFEPQRVAEEVVWQLDKTDIDEELTRLREHLSHFLEVMRSPKSEGKKLDFYTQELLREVNTIGSKANHTQITQAVIEAKTLIEQIKEQVQNIE